MWWQFEGFVIFVLVNKILWIIFVIWSQNWSNKTKAWKVLFLMHLTAAPWAASCVEMLWQNNQRITQLSQNRPLNEHRDGKFPGERDGGAGTEVPSALTLSPQALLFPPSWRRSVSAAGACKPILMQKSKLAHSSICMHFQCDLLFLPS